MLQEWCDLRLFICGNTAEYWGPSSFLLFPSWEFEYEVCLDRFWVSNSLGEYSLWWKRNSLFLGFLNHVNIHLLLSGANDMTRPSVLLYLKEAQNVILLESYLKCFMIWSHICSIILFENRICMKCVRYCIFILNHQGRTVKP